MRKPKGKRLVIFLTLLHAALMFCSGSSWIVTSYRRYIFAKRNNSIDLDDIFSFPVSHSHPSSSVWVHCPLFCFLPWNLVLTNWKWSLPMSHFLVTCKFCCLGGQFLFVSVVVVWRCLIEKCCWVIMEDMEQTCWGCCKNFELHIWEAILNENCEIWSVL